MKSTSSYNMITCYDNMRLMFEQMWRRNYWNTAVTQLDWVCLG